MKKQLMLAVCLLLITASCKKTETKDIPAPEPDAFAKKLEALKTSEQYYDSLLLANYQTALTNFITDSSATNFIWLGRRIAYTGQFEEAIHIYTRGISQYPEDARLYRHRGHRYISTRQFDKAIADLLHAASLIKDTEDIIEPDGIPNKLNTPVSSLHTNIWYHLGLAYYLQNDLEKALSAFNNCLAASKNDDMIVATSHWLYMIHRRLNDIKAADAVLAPITANMTIIENDGYHQLLLFYKGELAEDQLTPNGSAGASEAVQYGIANWYHYNDEIEKAKTLYKALIANGNEAGFGYIAAEADLRRLNEELINL
ncbi:MAG: tetratricopeptide repeat protein [bacterium]